MNEVDNDEGCMFRLHDSEQLADDLVDDESDTPDEDDGDGDEDVTLLVTDTSCLERWGGGGGGGAGRLALPNEFMGLDDDILYV